MESSAASFQRCLGGEDRSGATARLCLVRGHKAAREELGQAPKSPTQLGLDVKTHPSLRTFLKTGFMYVWSGLLKIAGKSDEPARDTAALREEFYLTWL